jgi:hypothetical protein
MRATLTGLYHLLRGAVHLPATPIKNTQPVHCEQPPSNQTIADIFKDGWFSALPNEFGAKTGTHRVFDPSVDDRRLYAHTLL